MPCFIEPHSKLSWACPINTSFGAYDNPLHHSKNLRNILFWFAVSIQGSNKSQIRLLRHLGANYTLYLRLVRVLDPGHPRRFLYPGMKVIVTKFTRKKNIALVLFKKCNFESDRSKSSCQDYKKFFAFFEDTLSLSGTQ